jgi:hypothetical protein
MSDLQKRVVRIKCISYVLYLCVFICPLIYGTHTINPYIISLSTGSIIVSLSSLRNLLVILLS